MTKIICGYIIDIVKIFKVGEMMVNTPKKTVTSNKKIIIISVAIILATVLLLIAFYSAIIGFFVLCGIVAGVILVVALSMDSFSCSTASIHGGCIITSANGRWDVVIPEEINGEKVLGIAEGAFEGETDITSIQLPSTLKSIDKNAFYGCTALEKIEIPDSVEYIGDYAFYGCERLNEFEASGQSLRYIGEGALEECHSLTKVTLGDGLEEIGTRAFAHCTELTSLYLGKSVEKIGENAFIGCTKLEGVTIPESVNEISIGAFWLCEKLKFVAFESASNWAGANGNEAEIIFTDLDNPETAAEYITVTYSQLRWVKL